MTGLLILAAVGGCGRVAPKTDKSTSADPPPAAYLAPPAPTLASTDAAGDVHITGTAAGGAVVRLRSPTGETVQGVTGTDGRWALSLPTAAKPRLYAFEAILDGRAVRGEGALCVLPAPAHPVWVLRAGAGAVPVGFGGDGALGLASLDYDSGGGAAVAGFGPVATRVRLTIDGAAVGMGKTNGQGRFGILVPDPSHGLGLGEHKVGVETPRGDVASVRLSISPPPPLAGSDVYNATRVEGGWRIAWRLPGGGAQISLLFDPASSPTKAAQP